MSQVVTGAARAGASPGGPKIRRAAATDARDGPLPMLLLTLTIVTGIIDAVSILSLGHVFVANMTGNLVFTGFAAVGTPGFSPAALAAALAGFVAGALGGSRLAQRWAGHRGHLLRNTTTMEFVLVGAMMILSIVVPHPLPCGRDLMLIVLGAAMGSQSAAMRRIGVPGLPTANVVTTTLTGLLADIAAARPGPYLGRRMAALAAITGGAALGAVLVLHASPATALGAATGLLALVSAAAHRLSPGAPTGAARLSHEPDRTRATSAKSVVGTTRFQQREDFPQCQLRCRNSTATWFPFLDQGRYHARSVK